MSGWRVGSRLVSRCGDSPRMRAAWPWRPVRLAILRASAWLELAGGLGEVDEDETAVVCLAPPPRLRYAPRLLAGLVAFLVASIVVLVLISAVWAPLLAVYGAAAVGLFGRSVLKQWRDRAVSAELHRAQPAGGWYLHNVARHPDHPGAGRALLERVVQRADAEGRTLYLDTVVPRLVEYYGEFGFEVAATVEARYDGEVVQIVRMVRRPR